MSVVDSPFHFQFSSLHVPRLVNWTMLYYQICRYIFLFTNERKHKSFNVITKRSGEMEFLEKMRYRKYLHSID